jgi:hypothetical protein
MLNPEDSLLAVHQRLICPVHINLLIDVFRVEPSSSPLLVALAFPLLLHDQLCGPTQYLLTDEITGDLIARSEVIFLGQQDHPVGNSRAAQHK